MTYHIGVVGVGHWATQFEDVVDGDLSFARGADVVPYDEKKPVLDRLGIDRDGYTDLSDAPHGRIPAEFFGGVDAVQIASPISAHEPQTLQAIRSVDDAVVAVDKAYGPHPSSFHAAEAYSEATGTTVYPQLHYLRKHPTLRMDEELPDAVDEHGPITRVDAAFVEETCEADRERTWVLDPREGGIAMDWIHPVETLVYATDASFNTLHDTEGYRVEPSYDREHPTAVRSRFTVTGDQFDEALYDCIVGKGFDQGTHKAMSITFEDGATIHVTYDSAVVEREEGRAGSIVEEDAGGELLAAEELSGPTPYTLMAADLIDAVERGNRPLDAAEQEEMYGAVHAINTDLFGEHYPHGETVAPDALVTRTRAIDQLWQDARSVGPVTPAEAR